MDDDASARRLLEWIIATGPPALEPRVMLSRLLMKYVGDREATEQAIRGVLAPFQPNHAERKRTSRRRCMIN